MDSRWDITSMILNGHQAAFGRPERGCTQCYESPTKPPQSECAAGSDAAAIAAAHAHGGKPAHVAQRFGCTGGASLSLRVGALSGSRLTGKSFESASGSRSSPLNWITSSLPKNYRLAGQVAHPEACALDGHERGAEYVGCGWPADAAEFRGGRWGNDDCRVFRSNLGKARTGPHPGDDFTRHAAAFGFDRFDGRPDVRPLRASAPGSGRL